MHHFSPFEDRFYLKKRREKNNNIDVKDKNLQEILSDLFNFMQIPGNAHSFRI